MREKKSTKLQIYPLRGGGSNLCREFLPFVELLLEKLLHRFQAFSHTTIHLHLNQEIRVIRVRKYQWVNRKK